MLLIWLLKVKFYDNNYNYDTFFITSIKVIYFILVYNSIILDYFL